jgi:hypothetical protein
MSEMKDQHKRVGSLVVKLDFSVSAPQKKKKIVSASRTGWGSSAQGEARGLSVPEPTQSHLSCTGAKAWVPKGTQRKSRGPSSAGDWRLAGTRGCPVTAADTTSS